MAYKEDLNIGKITLIGLVSVLLTVALVLFLQVLFYGFKENQLASPLYRQVPAEMTKYVAEQQGKLASYEMVDRERKVVTIPIERAMDLVVAGLAADPQAHVTGVPDPEDAVVPEPTGDEDSDNAEGTDDNARPAADPEPKPDPDADAVAKPTGDSSQASSGASDESDTGTADGDSADGDSADGDSDDGDSDDGDSDDGDSDDGDKEDVKADDAASNGDGDRPTAEPASTNTGNDAPADVDSSDESNESNESNEVDEAPADAADENSDERAEETSDAGS